MDRHGAVGRLPVRLIPTSTLPVMSDPFITAARRLFDDAVGVLRDAVTGADAAVLNTKPAGDDTNAIAALVAHALGAARLLVAVAVDAPHPHRDRPGEFATTVPGPEALLAMIDAQVVEVTATLDRALAVDWSATRSFPRADGSTAEMTAAFALMHAIDHLRGHADEASLSRHVLNR